MAGLGYCTHGAAGGGEGGSGYGGSVGGDVNSLSDDRKALDTLGLLASVVVVVVMVV